MPRRVPPSVVVGCVAVALLSGCSALQRTDGDTATMAPGSPSGGGATPRTIACEVFAIRSEQAAGPWTDDLWPFVDEQVFAAPLRERLAAAGIRAGIVGDPPPECLATRLLPGTDEPGTAIADPARVRTVLRLLPGQEGELVTAEGPRQFVILEHDRGAVGGGIYDDASGILAIDALPAADGRIQVSITPVVKHGRLSRQWKGADGAFRLEAGQERRTFDTLRLQIELTDHQALVISGDGAEAATVGDAFFRDEAAGHPCRRLLVIRPLARGRDPRFASVDDGTASGNLGSPRQR